MCLDVRRTLTDLQFKRQNEELQADAMIILPLQVETSAVVSRKSTDFNDPNDLMYCEDVQVGGQFKNDGQLERIEVAIESWITEKGTLSCFETGLWYCLVQLFADTTINESDEFGESSPYEAPKFVHELDASIPLTPDEKHVFKCLFVGVPLPEVEWSIDNQSIEVTRQVK